MTIYRFSDDSVIQEVVLHRSGERMPVALLSAGETVQGEQIAAIRAAIEAHGWKSVPANADGRDVLQVDGFSDEGEFTAFLKEKGFVAGTPQISSEPQENAEVPARGAIRGFFRRRSLQLAGVLNLIGDIGFLGKGIADKDKYKITGGSLYTLGGLNLTVFGKAKSGSNLREVSERIAAFIGKASGTPAENIPSTEQQVSKEEKFLYRNVADNTLAIYTAGASAMLASGIKKYRAGEGSASLYYGLSSLIFKVTSFLIPEKTKNDGYDAQEREQSLQRSGIFARAVDWVKEKPLRVFGYGSFITDSILAVQTYQEFRQSRMQGQKKGYLWTALTTVTYLLADVMAAISNKNPENAAGKFDAYEQRHIVALAAEEIAKRPAAEQEKLAEQTAEFLTTQPEMKGDPSEIRATLRKQVKSMGHNSWAERASVPGEAQIA